MENEMRENLLNLIIADHEIKMKKNRILGKQADLIARDIVLNGDNNEVKNLIKILSYGKLKKINYLSRRNLKKGNYLAIEMFDKKEKESKNKKYDEFIKRFPLKKDDFIDEEFVNMIENIDRSMAFKIIRIHTDYGKNDNAQNLFVKDKFISFNECINYYKDTIKEKCINAIKTYGASKLNIIAKINVYNEFQYTNSVKNVKFFRNKVEIMKNDNDLNDKIFGDFLNKFDVEIKYAFENLEGSGWVYVGCNEIDINIYRPKNTKVGSYIKSPDWTGKGLINIKNEDDDECFKYCVNYHYENKTKKKNCERLSVLKNTKKYNFDGVNFPCSLDDVERFERKNKSISINVFNENSGNFMMAYNSKNKTDDVCNLLLLNDGDKSHFCYIKNMGTLKKQTNGNTHKIICEKCSLEYDKRYLHKCSEVETKTKIEFLKNGSINNFKIAKMLEHPFVCYFDFESMIVETGDEKKKQHIVNSYAYKIICSFNEKYNTELKLYRGENACKNFIDAVCKEQNKISKIIKELRNKYEKPVLSAKEENDFLNCKKCYLCDCELDKNNKIREHCHLTGKYRGASCEDCNLKFVNKNENKLICMSHNLNYDGAFILAEAKEFTDKIDIISTTEEKFMTFEFCNLVFKDTLKFLTDSLEKLVNTLHKDDMKYTKAFYKNNFEVAMRKGVYPYEWIDSMEKFKEKGLPDYKYFYSSLKNENVSKKDYKFAKETYKKLKCKKFGDYHDHYLRLDVLLLCDVFQNFRAKCKDDLKVDPCNYVSIASVSYDAFLLNMKKNKMDVKTIENEEVKTFYDKHKRGAICQVFGRKHVKANNKYMGDDFDKTKESNFILYIDANNLYGWAMTRKLPFRIIGKEDITMEQIRELDDEGTYGYTVCCDLSFPEELHDKFNGYVPAPEKRSVDKTEISEFQKEILKINEIKNKDKSEKIILDLHEKKEYVVDFRLLKLYETLGVKVDKVHYGYKYEMDYVIKDYIEQNTKKRAATKNEFYKNYYKLLNNIIYGKMLQDIMGQNDTCITKNDDKAMKIIGYNTFKDLSYQNGFYTIHTEKKKVVFNKASYLGSTILDMSKYLMYDFHYNTMMKKYDDKCELIYTDTDSFVYNIKTDDLYKEMFEMGEFYDLTDVKIDKFRSDENNKKIGKFKDESKMVPIVEFVALKPKLYSYLVYGEDKYEDEDKKHLKAKGITKGAQKDMKHEMYITCSKDNEDKNIKQVRIQMFKRQVYTLETFKKGLSNYDDKMYRLNNYEAYSYGHYKIMN